MKFSVKSFAASVAACIGTAVILCPAALFGYVLPAPFIIDKMVEHLHVHDRFQVEQVLHLATDEKRDADSNGAGRYFAGGRFYNQKLQYLVPGQSRSDTEAGDVSHIHVSTAEGAMTVIDDLIVSESGSWFYRYRDLFSYTTRDDVSRKLEEIGVSLKETSLGRMESGGEKSIYYVVGAQYPDESVPQLWVDRESFLPVRMILNDSGGENGEPPDAEIRFSRWQDFSNMQYPSEITFLEKGIEIRKIRVKAIDAAPAFDSSLFDIQQLKEAYSFREKPPSDEGGEPDYSEEIRREIEQFRLIFE